MRSEHLEQVDFVSWFRKCFPDVLIFAIPNGGQRTRTTGAKLKAEGVVAGVPDLYIPAWNLWVEMKREKGGQLSPKQNGMISYLSGLPRHEVVVGYGADDARNKILSYAERQKKW